MLMEFMKQRKAYDVGIIIFTVLCLSLIPNAKAGAAAGIKICAANFPDKNIRKIAKKADANKNGYLSVSERRKVEQIFIAEKTNISSFQGIEYFTGITNFYYGGGTGYAGAEILDLSKNKKLESISIGSGGKSGLKTIVLKDMKNLKEISIDRMKKLKNIYFSKDNALRNVRVEVCPKLSSIDFSGCPNLEEAVVWNSGVKTLDLSQCAGLKSLDLEVLPLTSLNVADRAEMDSVVIETCMSLKKIKVNSVKTLQLNDNWKLSSLHVNKVVSFSDSSGSKNLAEYGISQPEMLEHFSYRGNKTELEMSDYVNLHSISIFDMDLKSLGLKGLKELTKVSVTNAKVTDIPLLDCSSVKSLELHGCSDITAANLKRLAEMETLESLVLDDCDVTELDFSKSTELESLVLEFCNLKELDLSKNKKLKKLSLWKIPIISQSVPDYDKLDDLSVKECASLEKIEFGRIENIYLENNERLSSLLVEQVGTLHDVQNGSLKEYKFQHSECLGELLYRGKKTSVDLSGYTALRYLDICGTEIASIDLSGTLISKKAVREGKATLYCEKSVNVMYAEEK